MKKYILALAVVLVALPTLSFADVQGDVNPNPSSSCVPITHDLSYRSRDAATGGDVSTLQDFLERQGYLHSDPTGYFGLQTQTAVESFQSASSILNSGYVGPITRADINTKNCAVATNPIPPSCAAMFNTSTGGGPCAPGTSGCAPGALYNSLTGAPCAPTGTPGCATGTLFNILTGAPCSGTQTLPSIIVTYPSGSQMLTPGQVVKIQWQALNLNTVDIALTEGSYSYTIAQGVSASQGYYMWTIPSLEYGAAQYQITVSGTSSGGVAASAKSGFITLSANAGCNNGSQFNWVTGAPCPNNPNNQPASITVTYPQAGYNLDDSGEKGNGNSPIATIQWTSSNLGSDSVAIVLTSSTGVQKTIATGLSSTATSYVWAYDPTLLNGMYQIQVYDQSVKGATVSGSSGYFTIANSPASGIVPLTPIYPITVLSPSYTTDVAIGETMSVSWTSGSPLQPVDVKILDASGNVVPGLTQLNLTPSSANAESIGFATLIQGEALLNVGQQYKARVCIAGTTNCSDSSGIFVAIPAVSNVVPTISSVSPQPISVGSMLTVNLANAGRQGNLILQTQDGSKSWSTGYASDISTLPGFLLYNGSTISFPIPSTIGRGELPENSGYEAPIPLTAGSYNLYVVSLDANNNFIKSNIATVVVGGTQ